MQRALPDGIQTTRLHLRRPVAADAAAIYAAYTQDAQVARYMIWASHDSLSVSEEFIARCMGAWETGTRLPYVIAQRQDGGVLGMIEARPQAAMLDIGYVLARPHWGRGLMPEAIEALATTALASERFFRVQASCDVENVPSQRALEKAGFRREGRLERFTVHPNISPEPRPCYMYARCR